MAVKSDIEIAREAVKLPIREVAERLEIPEEDLECYGRYKAKIGPGFWEKVKDRPDGKLVLVTAINPTPAGEGKTTITRLAQPGSRRKAIASNAFWNICNHLI